ncbi:hypothetical protein J005_06554 [Cryptococcus neoformans]|nr:hypothetical protein C344_06424 [Cryptococcus neoformans var. grubii AD1-7a]OXH22963.1 hypothetical protein J005_06554 [Cryptococcus neoformans var. grubii]
MPREPQTTKRPPILAPQHRAQRIGDLLEREEYEYRTWILLLFTIEYCWVGEPGPCYANITFKSKDMGYLKSHDMSMTFSETDASKILNQLMPSKTRTNNAAEEISEVPSSNQPSSTTASIRIPDIEIVFSYGHPKAGAEGSESKSTDSQKKRMAFPPISSEQSLPRAMSYVFGCGYQMFRLLRALAVCGTRFARIWTLSDCRGRRTFAVETSRPLGNSSPMVAADFFLAKSVSAFSHNLIIPSPSTHSFAVAYRKCGFLKRTFSHVCDSIRKYTVESALQPRYENTLTMA